MASAPANLFSFCLPFFARLTRSRKSRHLYPLLHRSLIMIILTRDIIAQLGVSDSSAVHAPCNTRLFHRIESMHVRALGQHCTQNMAPTAGRAPAITCARVACNFQWSHYHSTSAVQTRSLASLRFHARVRMLM